MALGGSLAVAKVVESIGTTTFCEITLNAITAGGWIGCFGSVAKGMIERNFELISLPLEF